jgi:hypothetical protein
MSHIFPPRKARKKQNSKEGKFRHEHQATTSSNTIFNALILTGAF